MKIIKQYKIVRDCIHGYISLSNLMVYIIDSHEFQRLRKLRQLGLCHYVFPNATHTRHEHSIGTAHLAGRIMDCVIKSTPQSDLEKYLEEIPELQNYFIKTGNYYLDDYIVELVKIAALCHDLGHGPFSHLFDDMFITTGSKHEERSCILLRRIILKDKYLSSIIEEDHIKFMCNLINPSQNHQGFIYQIVSNNVNGMDVDKYDYIARDSRMLNLSEKPDFDLLIDHIRVIDNIICYPDQSLQLIKQLFNQRYNLHKIVYSHKSVIAVDLMLIDILTCLDPILEISKSVNDMDKFIQLTDEFVLTSYISFSSPYYLIPDNLKNNLNQAISIINKLNQHKLYTHIGTIVTHKTIDISHEQFSYSNDVVVFQTVIGYVGGSKSNPFDNIYTFNTKDQFGSLKKNKCNMEKHSKIITKKYQENLTMIFSRNKELEVISKLKSELEIFKS